MHVLKFRAWDKGHSKITYKVNLYSLNYSGTMIRAQLDNKQIMNNVGFDCDIMQFTGKTDKNGEDIYEGDIVKYCKATTMGPKARKKEFKATVVWDNNESAFRLDDPEDTHPYNTHSGGIDNSEVIGNIYENKL